MSVESNIYWGDMEIPTLLFIDPVCPRPYDPDTIEGRGLGGTEQTIVTLAEGLSKTGLFKVVVEQHNRRVGDIVQCGASYVPIGNTTIAKWVIVLRNSWDVNIAKLRFPNSNIYLFSHDLATNSLGESFEKGAFTNCYTNICVSNWHKTQIIELLKIWGYTGQFRNRVIYNPLSEDCIPDDSSYDPNKLMWLASPHKGLDRAFAIFKHLVKLNPDFKLYITNPGYLEDKYSNDAEISSNVVTLGTINHNDVIRHLKTSLCLFYPNTVFPETFGKVMAEANSVGTPVLTHPMGAAPEVLDKGVPGQLVDCFNIEKVIQRVLDWRNGRRPVVLGNPKFKLHNVVQEWVNLLQDTR